MSNFEELSNRRKRDVARHLLASNEEDGFYAALLSTTKAVEILERLGLAEIQSENFAGKKISMKFSVTLSQGEPPIRANLADSPRPIEELHTLNSVLLSLLGVKTGRLNKLPKSGVHASNAVASALKKRRISNALAEALEKKYQTQRVRLIFDALAGDTTPGSGVDGFSVEREEREQITCLRYKPQKGASKLVCRTFSRNNLRTFCRQVQADSNIPESARFKRLYARA